MSDAVGCQFITIKTTLLQDTEKVFGKIQQQTIDTLRKLGTERNYPHLTNDIYRKLRVNEMFEVFHSRSG